MSIHPGGTGCQPVVCRFRQTCAIEGVRKISNRQAAGCRALTARAPQNFVILVALFLVSGCGYFAPQPPLPRSAAIERSESQEKFAALIQDADIIYFPSESVALRSRSDAAWKLLDALRAHGGSYAIGCDWTANETERANYLTEAGKGGGKILPLHEAETRSRDGGSLGAEQLIADEIASYLHEHRSGKVLVFLSRVRLGMSEGVPYFVAQKTKARQLILNPTKHSDSGARLLAGR